MKAVEKYFPVVLFVTLFKFWVREWNPKVWPLIESYWAVISFGAVCYAYVQGGSNVWMSL